MMIPTTVYGMAAMRTALPALLRKLADSAGGAVAFGRHGRAEAVIAPYILYSQLVEAAVALDDVHAAQGLERYLRHPGGPSQITVPAVADLLRVTVPASNVPADRPLTAWPGAVDDLMRLGDELPVHDRDRVLGQVVAVAAGLERGDPIVTAPGQVDLSGWHRFVVGLADGRVVVLTASDPAGDGVALLSIRYAGALLTRLYELPFEPDADAAG